MGEINNENNNNIEATIINGQPTDPEVIKAMEKAQAKLAKKAEHAAWRAKKKEELIQKKEEFKQHNLEKKAENEALKGMNSNQIDEIISSIKDEDMKLVAQLLVEIKKGNDREIKLARKQSIFSLCTSVLCLILVSVILIWGIRFAPTIEKLANDATVLVANTNGLVTDTTKVVDDATAVIEDCTRIISQTGSIVEQTGNVINNLDKITEQLAKTDIEGMMNNINDLVVESEESMAEAVGKLTAIDIDTLNKAIAELQAVVEPLSRFFKK